MASPGSLANTEIEVPDIGPKEVLMRVELSGICGPDVHMYEGGFDFDFPAIPGREVAGVVEEVGESDQPTRRAN